MKIEINKGKFKVDEFLITNAFKRTVKKLKRLKKITPNQNIEISVAVVDREKIREINKQWRKKDEETDVLSFCYESTKEKLEGEVIVCLDIIKENAQKDGIKTEKELEKNIIHSILHIAGYEHGDEMFDLQKEILKKII